MLLVLDGATRPIRVACGREFQTSIRQSAKKAIESAIHRSGLDGFYDIRAHEIVGKNGTLFFFRGLEVNREEIRGWEDIDHVWIEEAQRMSEATARVLIPTIRKPHSSLWFTWNAHHRTDWVWRRFILQPRADDVIAKINYNDNPWFPLEAEEERLSDKRHNPDMYAHIWEGEPDDEGGGRAVLPFAMVMECVEAWNKHPEFIRQIKADTSIPRQIGLDVADTGDNFNALVERKGPLITHAEKWRTKFIGNTARRADTYARANEVNRIIYDAGGVGAGVKSYFADFPDRGYVVVPEQFGAAVKGGDVMYSYRISNRDFFSRRNAQMGWTLRVWAQNTRDLLSGEKINPMRCLFIDPSLDKLDEFASQLSQPKWKESTTGKVEIDKRDNDEASPDLYDAAILSFARDSMHGLRKR